MSEPVEVVERVLQILASGSYTSTYKLAVLVGLMDLCLANTAANGAAPTSITTRQLAEKVVELYWPQVSPWDGDRLRQNRGKPGVILRAVEELRDRADTRLSTGAGFARVRIQDPAATAQAINRVEWKLIQMPLPKLQRVGGEDTGWLYRIGWTDETCPSTGTIRAYQAGKPVDFDNRILLRPEVATAFVRLHGILRPFVEQRWAMEVARINTLEKGRLHEFLFGADRVSLTAVRQPLHAMQAGQCFYCQRRLQVDGSHVDHFLPWSRHADNGLDNLVVAHAKCNSAKRDYLAALPHIERWRSRREDQLTVLADIADDLGWDVGGERTLGAARALYLRLPQDSRLWSSGNHFEAVDPAGLRRVLG
jgi:5-methylcytosine-specific restriction endonuclease McrA